MAGLFSTATLEQVRAASDIVEVIGSALPLKRAGANFVALCPFHKEKTPSFNVNPHKQIFHCFGCHKGGDVFTFVQEFENVSFTEAVQRLAERAKIPLRREGESSDAPNRFLKESLLNIHEQIAQRWHHALLHEASGEPARAYLAGRGVPDDAIRLFRLGFAPDAWDDTLNWGKSRGFEPALLEQAGLVIRREEDGRYYDRFRGRLMFPICDEQGRVVGFSGRILKGDEKGAKYVNSPETAIFKKGKIFFGLDKSKRALLEAQFAVICEGQLDLIACYMAGVQNVVAPQGTAFTSDHARILKRYVDEVVLCFDSDNAGQAAAIRVLDHLLASGLAIRVATVPAPHDPDSFIKQFGGDAFQKLIREAEGFFDYYLRRLCETNDVRTDRGQLALLKGMAEAVCKTGNAVMVDRYAQKTAMRLGVSADAVRAQFRKFSRTAPARSVAEEDTPEDASPEPISRPSPHEFWLLKLVLLHEDLAGWAASHLDLDWIQHSTVREIVKVWLAPAPSGDRLDVATLLAHFEDANVKSLISEALAESRPIPNPQQQLQDVILRLRNLSIDAQVAALTQRLADPQIDDAVRAELLVQQNQLRVAKRQPLACRQA